MSRRKPKTPAIEKQYIPELTPAEMGDGDFDAELKQKKMEAQVRTRLGDDGMEETHVTYKHRKEIIQMGGLGERYDEIDWEDE